MADCGARSAYVHIPFCIRKCPYCDFASYPGKERLFGSYVEAVREEIRRTAAECPSPGISTIYFGGGTPNLLSPEQPAEVLDEIKACFPVAEDAEISTEANPGIAVSGIRQAGFNRLSLGVQSLHDDELAHLGRVHTAEQARAAFGEARNAGFGNISIDLMYGIPSQTPESWKQTLAAALELAPEHVSLYSLTIEEDTPFHATYGSGRLELPGDDAEADMYEEAIRTLTGAGFEHYEVSNFARPGFRCRHNIVYWRNEPYYGFGSGATSCLGGLRATNTPGVEEYIRRVSSGEIAKDYEERLSGRQAMGETMFLGLRMLEGIDTERFRVRYGVSSLEVFADEIESLRHRGLIEVTPHRVRLTHTGLLLANEVFSRFVG